MGPGCGAAHGVLTFSSQGAPDRIPISRDTSGAKMARKAARGHALNRAGLCWGFAVRTSRRQVRRHLFAQNTKGKILVGPMYRHHLSVVKESRCANYQQRDRESDS